VSDFEAVVRWYLVLALMAGVGLPLGTIILGDSRRYAAWFSRPIGMLAVFFPTWFLSSSINLPYTTVGLYATLVVVGAGAWFYVVRTKLFDLAEWPIIAVAEITTLLTFLGALWLRGFTPNILNTEKPMDAAFLASTIRTDIMPPPDPWMSGESINYYYVGYALHGAIARMSGVALGQSYNLALITTTAIIVAAVIGAAAVALPKWARYAGPIAAFLIVIAGNMVAPVRYLENGRVEWDMFWTQGIGWSSTRVIYDSPDIYAITEFPSFSIILGDLHPHLMALPFTIVVLAFAILIARQQTPVTYPQLGAAGLLGGGLYAMNTWDLPTYFGLVLIAILWNLRSTGRRQILLRGGTAVAVAAVAWAPFILTFTPPGGADSSTIPSAVRNIPILKTIFKTVGANDFAFTSAGEFLRIFGLPYVLVCVALIFAARDLPASISDSRVVRQVGILASVFIVIALLAGVPVLVLVAIPGAIAGWILYRKSIQSLEGLISALFIAGSFLVLLCEFFYIHDIYTSRMNTIFKAYYQVWTLWGLGAALSICFFLGTSVAVPKHRTRQILFTSTVIVSVVLGILNPITTINQFLNLYNPTYAWAGLDGSKFVGKMSPDEAAGIQFIADNASDDSVVLQTPGCSYQPYGSIPFDQVAIFTGVPTVAGWAQHERLWRGGNGEWLAELVQRRAQAQDFYGNPNREFVDQFDIDFVYYGIYEAGAGYRSCDGKADNAPELPKPTDAQMSAIGFTQVFQQGDVTIWQRTS
jgi:YYY domain-containing protein